MFIVRRLLAMLMVSLPLQPWIQSQPLDSSAVYRLSQTAKVWGFLKYYHSSVAAKKLNWDSVLVQTIPAAIGAASNEQFNAALLSMIQAPGLTLRSLQPPPTVPESLRSNFDRSWITDPSFSQTVRDSLSAVAVWTRRRANGYVGYAFTNGNPTFTNDSQYYAMYPALPPADIRLVGLFRYWNIIHYFYPHRRSLDVPWDDILREFIPVFHAAGTLASYQRAVFALQARLGDSHAFTHSNRPADSIDTWFGSSYCLPILLNQVEGETVVMRSVDPGADIHPGDVIRTIGGVDITTIRNMVRPFVSGSNAATIERNIDYRLTHAKKGTSVTMEVESATGIRSVTLWSTLSPYEWRDLIFSSVPPWRTVVRNGRSIGIVNIENLRDDLLDSLFTALSAVDRIVFDIRNYPLTLSDKIYRYLFSGPLAGGFYTYPDIGLAGTESWVSLQKNIVPIGTPYAGSIVIIVNEETQSAAEGLAGTLALHPKASVIGSQTAGANGDISIVYLPGSMLAYYTGLGIFDRYFRSTQKVGVPIDDVIRPTIAKVRQGMDELMEYAMNAPFTAARQEEVLPSEPRLTQNFPNPFNPATTIRYQLPRTGAVTMEVYDLLGRRIIALVNEVQSAGFHDVRWNAAGLPSGVYLCRFRAGEHVQTNKLMITK